MAVTQGQEFDWLAEAISIFGASCKAMVNGPGDPEASIRPPLQNLLEAVGSHDAMDGVLWHSETPLRDVGVRPDYAVEVHGEIVGYVEVKRPGQTVDPEKFTGRNKKQWERLRDLPNVLYTNGTEWRLFRSGELIGAPVFFDGDLGSAGHSLSVREPAAFHALLRTFLHWVPEPIRHINTLVRRTAPLCRLLRAAVLEQLEWEGQYAAEGARPEELRFTGLKNDWRRLLFPSADDATFADGYAQTVTFALLLARTEDISVKGVGLHEIGRRLDNGHALMGKALQLLTDNITVSFEVSLDLLIQVVDAVDWAVIRRGRRDAYLHLYESFLEVYDEKLRQKSGSYYTPREIVEEMVRLTEDVLRTRLSRQAGYADDSVRIVDPAMGTGTYLHAVIEHVAAWTADNDGPGAIPDAIGSLAKRLIGFELQMGPFAVAELRASDLLKRHQAVAPPDGMKLFVTDTLDNPYLAEETLASTYGVISESRRRANQVKANTPVTVAIGNPPYDDKAMGRGGWIEKGSPAQGSTPIEAFKWPGNGRYEHVLKNLYIYFWRWATWKVFDAHQQDQQGVVCFITPAGFTTGPGGRGMRNYLRRTCDEGWVIDLSPEGHRPDVATRIFPGVAQPLAICIFVRSKDTDPDRPAHIHYRAVHGRRADKYRQLKEIQLDDDGWQDAHSADIRPFRPSTETGWEDHPALDDLFLWGSLGITANRSWVNAPSDQLLQRRWARLIHEADPDKQAKLFKETRDRSLHACRPPLPGQPEHAHGLADETDLTPDLIRIAMRSFDRQWLISDSRVIDFARPTLWEALQPGQLFLNQQSSQEIETGPAVVATALLPDTHHFNGRGGKIMPILHPDGTPNVHPRLLAHLATELGLDLITVHDLAAYVAAVAGHSGFTERFAEELRTPGVRLPLTRDPDLWHQAVNLGERLLWASTYGERYIDPKDGRPAGDVLFPPGDPRRLRYDQHIGTEVPSEIHYAEMNRTLYLGAGFVSPVPTEVWNYDVGGMQIVKKWFGYRKANPNSRKTSPLDDLHVDSWPSSWSRELMELLSVLRRLTDLAPVQQELLDRILAGPKVTVADLGKAAILPVSDKARRPRRQLKTSHDELHLDADEKP
ncbi:N-6 DNA Methylase [Nocardia amikacinitolerans]|uniref:type ISP restriction/modification enzyme n=1 Tax=Nocardia amikacinitolerans TaxID=756689 RepID=UPI0020A36136|nr:type ISP restriction/modification enzyme [Nocardia amikacinitolerans]MCP2297210.1 N-6 DNA Methylase [Nocardia amikacinitolerans]